MAPETTASGRYWVVPRPENPLSASEADPQGRVRTVTCLDQGLERLEVSQPLFHLLVNFIGDALGLFGGQMLRAEHHRVIGAPHQLDCAASVNFEQTLVAHRGVEI